jgi:phosphomannomutase
MSFFKAYDMRGTFAVDFDIETVRLAGRALVEVLGAGRWLVGRDMRNTSAAVRDALVAALEEAGAEVSDMGLATTPMVYFFTAEDGFDASVMITASHNPPTDNGLKVSRRGALPVGYADGLDRVERLCAERRRNPRLSAELPSSAAERSVRGGYLERYLEWMQAHAPDFSNLRFAVDCSNGMASLFAARMFPSAIVVNDVPDGNFPAHSPNPLEAAAREQASKLVREKGLDLAVIFDGDADRCMFLDERGEFVQCDYLTGVIAKACAAFASRPLAGETVVHDVRTSRGTIESLREAGATTLAVPVGHAFAKPALRRSGAICGGELAGHYYFGDFHCCDSGLLAALRILGEVAAAKRAGMTFSEMMRPVTGRYANSGELNFKVADKAAAVERVMEAAGRLGEIESVLEIDGKRVEYADGWFNVRVSNTEPYLRLIVECRSAAKMEEWKRMLGEVIGES